MYTFSQLTSAKPKESYTKNQVQAMRLLSSSERNLATPFGSATISIQGFPSDLDLHEIFEDCSTIEHVLHTFAIALQVIVENVLKRRLTYFSEVKAGIDTRFIVDIGPMVRGRWMINKPEIEKALRRVQKFLNKDEISSIEAVLNKRSVTQQDYDMVYNLFRGRRILRWTAQEVLNGSKTLPGNVVMTLQDALRFKTHVKIDTIIDLDGKLVETTNFWILVQKLRNGGHRVINLTFDYLDREVGLKNYNIQLKEEIDKLLYSRMFYNPFKAVKRMFALARTNRNEKYLKRLAPLVSGNISRLYQQKSDLGTILRLTEILSKSTLPHATIDGMVERMKQNIANVVELKADDAEKIYTLLNKFLEDHNYENLQKASKLMAVYVNDLAIAGLKKLRLLPPPKIFMPATPQYFTGVGN